MAEPVVRRYAGVGGVEIALHFWGPAEGWEDTAVFVHATGHHARCWDQVVAALPRSWRCVAVDLRGHGLSGGGAPAAGRAAEPPYTDFAVDVAAALRHAGVAGAVGVGHSMGGYAAAVAAARAPGLFRALLLADPIIFHPSEYDEEWLRKAYGDGVAELREPHPAGRRRAGFASADAMLARVRGRAPFADWDPRCVRDYCAHAVRPAPGGEGVTLRCDPAFEGQLYVISHRPGAAPHADLARITAPVRIYRSDRARLLRGKGGARNISLPPIDDDLPLHFSSAASVEEVVVPTVGHFLPQCRPALFAAAVRDMARREADVAPAAARL